MQSLPAISEPAFTKNPSSAMAPATSSAPVRSSAVVRKLSSGFRYLATGRPYPYRLVGTSGEGRSDVEHTRVL